MGSFVGSGGVEIYSKKLNYQSGRPDLNRRPLDPQSRSGRRWTWLSVAQWTLDQPRQSPGVAGCRLMSACVGSWFGSFAGRPAARRPDSRETVNNARRAVLSDGKSSSGRTSPEAAEPGDLRRLQACDPAGRLPALPVRGQPYLNTRRISRAAAGSWRPWLVERELWPGMPSPASW